MVRFISQSTLAHLLFHFHATPYFQYHKDYRFHSNSIGCALRLFFASRRRHFWSISMHHIQRVEPTPARRVGIYGSFYLPLGIFSGLILIPKLFQPDDQQASQRVANPLRSENGPDRPTAEGEEFLLPSTTATVQASFGQHETRSRAEKWLN